MSTIKIRKGTFQHIESELSAYQDTKREIERIKIDILHGVGSSDENTGGGKSNLPGDPTGKKATRLTSDKRLMHLEAITEAVDSVVSRLPAEKKELIRLKYWTRPQTLTWDGIALQLNVSRRQAIRWRDEIVYVIAERTGWK